MGWPGREQPRQPARVPDPATPLEPQRVHLQPALPREPLDLRVGGADEPDVPARPHQAQAQVERRGDRAGTTTLMQDLRDRRPGTHRGGSP